MSEDHGVLPGPEAGVQRAKGRHTPGPWEVRLRFGRETTVSGRQRFPICDTGTAPLGQANHAREEANARLISQAPALLTVAWDLAMLAIQSQRYGTDPDFRDAVDNTLDCCRFARGDPTRTPQTASLKSREEPLPSPTTEESK